MFRSLALAVILGSLISPVSAQEKSRKKANPSYPPQMEGCRIETYKTLGETRLQLYIFSPETPRNAPAIVFFFGGGWKSGTPQQFESQCRHLAQRGMVAITADYRVQSRHQVKPTECVADARSAMRWVRAHAEELGIDPNRIAAGGGSAGGHLAASTAFISEFDATSDDQTVRAEPDALILFNPALVLAPIEGLNLNKAAERVPEERLGTKPEKISPAHHIRSQGPPTIIFHGRNDTTVPYATAEAFTEKMKAAGNRCELKGYEGQKHGFFNNGDYRTRTLKEADDFLVSLGWLSASP